MDDVTNGDSKDDTMACCDPTSKPAAACCGPTREADEVAQLARVGQALSDPIRLAMLDVMAQGRACCGLPEPAERGVPGSTDPVGVCVCDFQEHFGIGQSKVSYHLRVLKEAGLVNEEPRGRWSFYTIDGGALDAALTAFRDLARA